MATHADGMSFQELYDEYAKSRKEYLKQQLAKVNIEKVWDDIGYIPDDDAIKISYPKGGFVKSYSDHYMLPHNAHSHVRGEFARLSDSLPGMNMIVLHPRDPDVSMVCIGTRRPLGYMIQHLNDYHRWTRDRIADWIEELDEVPAFQAPTTKKKEVFK